MRSSTSPPPTSWRARSHPKVVAIGEAGLDYHYDYSPRDAQERGFRNHIAAARETGLPLVIHSREADDDMARILEEETGKGAFPAVLHCYTGGPDLARRAIALGLSISFTGIVTFKKSDDLRAIAASLPADRFLVETDAPYLAPGKFRGKRNEPAYVVETAKVLAETRGVSFDELARQTTENFFRLFSKVPRPAAAAADKSTQSAQRTCMTLRFTILGCGSSGGVPRPALGWGVCDPNNPKNRRRRTSLLVERRTPDGVTRVLVDTSPDLREQLLDADVDWVDAVLFTHEHADHTHGIDDLRGLFINRRKRVPVWLDERVSQHHARPLRLLLHRRAPGSEYPPIVREHRMEAYRAVTVEGQGGAITALPILQEHGDITSLGFRFGALAYSCDLSGLPADSVDGARRPRRLDHRCAARQAASEPSQRLARRSTGSRASSPSARS